MKPVNAQTLFFCLPFWFKSNTNTSQKDTVSSALIQSYQTFQTVRLLKRMMTNMRDPVSRTCSAVSILSFPSSSRSLWTTTVEPRPSSTLASPCRTAGCPATSPTDNICRDYAATAPGRYPHTHTCTTHPQLHTCRRLLKGNSRMTSYVPGRIVKSYGFCRVERLSKRWCGTASHKDSQDYSPNVDMQRHNSQMH